MEATPTSSKRDKKRNRRCLTTNMRSSSASEDVIIFSTHEKRSPSSVREDKTSSNRKKGVSSRADEDSVSSGDFLSTNMVVEKRRSSPKTEKRHSSPKTEKRRSSPYTEKRRSSPYTEKRRSSPKTEKRRSSPKTEKRRSSPKTEKRRSSPYTEKRRCSPFTEKRRTSQKTEKRRSSPRTEKRGYSPKTEKRRSSPFTEKKRSSPYTDNRRSSPKTEKRRSSPRTEKRGYSPKTDNRRSSPYTEKRRSSPCTEKRRSSPCTEKRRSSPCTEKRRSSPCTEKRRSSPCTGKRRSSPCTEKFAKLSLDARSVYTRRRSPASDQRFSRSIQVVETVRDQRLVITTNKGNPLENSLRGKVTMKRRRTSSSSSSDGIPSASQGSHTPEPPSERRRLHISKPPNRSYSNRSTRDEVVRKRFRSSAVADSSPLRSAGNLQAGVYQSVVVKAEGGHDVETGKPSPMILSRHHSSSQGYDANASKRQVILERERAARTRTIGRISPITAPITSPITSARTRTGGRFSPITAPITSPITSARTRTSRRFSPITAPITSPITSARTRISGRFSPITAPITSPITSARTRISGRFSPITAPITSPITSARTRTSGRFADCHSHSPNLPTPMTSTRMNPEAAAFIPYTSPIYGSPSCNCYSSPTPGPTSLANYPLPRLALQGLDTPQLWALDLVARSKAYSCSFVDTHCHIDLLYDRLAVDHSTKFGDFQKQLASSFPVNYEGCLAVFCYPKTYAPDYPHDRLLHTLSQEDNIWFALGCHPKSATEFTARHAQSLRSALSHPRVVALGEVGLDYSGSFHRHAEIQKTVLRQQLQMAVELQLPLVIHCRDAYEDCFAILTEMVPLFWKIHLHCFCDNLETAGVWLDTFPNLYIGLTPVITYRSARGPVSTARSVPLDRLLLETDSPYFVPGSIKEARVSVSHPGFALFTAERIAELKNIPVETVLYTCRENTRLMYGI